MILERNIHRATNKNHFIKVTKLQSKEIIITLIADIELDHFHSNCQKNIFQIKFFNHWPNPLSISAIRHSLFAKYHKLNAQ